MLNETCAHHERVLAGHQGVQPLQAQRQMRAALVVGHSVDLVDDDCVHAAQMLTALLRREQDVQRFGRGDQDVRRGLQHRAALGRRRVARPDSRAHRRAQVAALEGELLNFAQGGFQVLLNVVGERLERRNINHLGLTAEAPFDRLADQSVDADEERRERLARTGRRGNQHRFFGEDHGPAELLGLGGGAKTAHEPLLHQRVGPLERLGNGKVLRGFRDWGSRRTCPWGVGVGVWGHRGQHPLILTRFSFLLRLVNLACPGTHWRPTPSNYDRGVAARPRGARPTACSSKTVARHGEEQLLHFWS